MAKKTQTSAKPSNALILDDAAIQMIDDIVTRAIDLETSKKTVAESIQEDKKALAARLGVSPSDISAVVNLVKKERMKEGAFEQSAAIVKAAQDVLLGG
jgi:hypothetical protein